MREFVKAALTSEVPQNESKIVELHGQTIAIFNINGEFYAIDNTCTHRGGPLGEGFLDGTIVTCPWHGWKFDVTTGTSPVNPRASVKAFPCKVEGQDILVEID